MSAAPTFYIRPATVQDHPLVATRGPATVIIRVSDGAGIIVPHAFTGRETAFWAELNWAWAEADSRQGSQGGALQ